LSVDPSRIDPADVTDGMPLPRPVSSIRTARFELVSMSLPFMRLLLARDLVAAAAEIGAAIPPDLRDRLDHFLQFRIADLDADPAAQPWLGRAIVIEDLAGRHVIGTVGFHSPPGPDGRVEIGYRVEPAYRRRGVATEVVRAMLDWAATTHGVVRFRAATAPDNVASQAVLARFGFRHVGRQMDDFDGEELVFELDGWAPTT
jgi:RimJ/RimL family protein N-acetyltransferase